MPLSSPPLLPCLSAIFASSLSLPVPIALAECHFGLDKAPVSVPLSHISFSALVHRMLVFVSWVRVTPLTHFNQPN